MDSKPKFIVPLDHAYDYPVSKVGGKSRNISKCKRAGFNVPGGFCISTDSYKAFLKANRLNTHIDMEILRKPHEDMRWEEIWDSSLRIRSSFMKASMPDILEEAILEAISKWPEGTRFAIRSSSPDEDSKEYSFAGVHESYINVSGNQEVLDKVKLVWASLWSDRSLLYKKEKSLDSLKSSMAVLVQKMEPREVSGLAFTADPSNKDREHIVIEVIRGSLNLLVDNVKSPERIKIRKASGEVESSMLLEGRKILDTEDARFLHSKIMELESLFGEPIDVEWTGLQEDFTVLQVRPITVFAEDKNTERKWYLTLTPKGQKLIDLAERVENVLIPELQKESEAFSMLSPENLSVEELVEELKGRGESYDRWTKVYWDEFIPFAHGIRNFGTFYNDLVKPQDPYEFIHLLKTEDMLAQKRNQEMASLSEELKRDHALKNELLEIMDMGYKGETLFDALENLKKRSDSSSGFVDSFLEFLREEMDMTYDNVRLEKTPEVSLGVIIKLSDRIGDSDEERKSKKVQEDYSTAYFDVAGKSDKLEDAEKWLRIGRVSWKLRDDDNILLGKIENQMLIFMHRGIDILDSEGRIDILPKSINPDDWKKVHKGLASHGKVQLDEAVKGADASNVSGGKPRQLLGQPSSPGLFTGKARVIRSLEAFKDIENGEVLVFDAVQPQMTFIIPLAGAIIERRGGMLVHSSIIAREMNIPAVNGVSKATELIRTGDIVTVNGDLGIVVLGKPEFEIELN